MRIALQIQRNGFESGRPWARPADAVDRRALRRVTGPALDIGCGPGRHVRALLERGIPAVGIDITPAAVRAARDRATPALRRCVFDPIPGSGRFRTALLLDGNIGIGGEPRVLLERVRELLAQRGRVVVECTARRPKALPTRARLVIDDDHGPWFAWRSIDLAELHALAPYAGFAVTETWRDRGRAFALLQAAVAP